MSDYLEEIRQSSLGYYYRNCFGKVKIFTNYCR